MNFASVPLRFKNSFIQSSSCSIICSVQRGRSPCSILILRRSRPTHFSSNNSRIYRKIWSLSEQSSSKNYLFSLCQQWASSQIYVRKRRRKVLVFNCYVEFSSAYLHGLSIFLFSCIPYVNYDLWILQIWITQNLIAFDTIWYLIRGVKAEKKIELLNVDSRNNRDSYIFPGHTYCKVK